MHNPFHSDGSYRDYQNLEIISEFILQNISRFTNFKVILHEIIKKNINKKIRFRRSWLKKAIMLI